MQAIQSPAIFSKSINIKHLHIYRCGTGLKTGIAQLVECLTKKPDAIQMWVWVPGMAREFSPSQLPVQTLVWCLYGPHVQPHASTSDCQCLEMQKCCTHWEEMGSTALEAAVPYPRKAAQISRKRQRGTKKINSKKGGAGCGNNVLFLDSYMAFLQTAWQLILRMSNGIPKTGWNQG